MVLIVLFLYFNVFTFSLNRNTDFQDVISRAQQLDADRNAEQITITDARIQVAQGGQVIVSCTLTNVGSVPVQLARLWVQDNNLAHDNVGSVGLTNSPIALQPGGTVRATFAAVGIPDALVSHSFYFWFVTFRGNLFSATYN